MAATLYRVGGHARNAVAESSGLDLSRMAQAQLLPRDLELPLDLRLPRVGAVDAVALEARAAELAKRSIKKGSKLAALDLAIRMMDLTTLEGADTPGKVAALCAKAMRPDPADSSDSVGRGGLRVPEPRRRGQGEARRLDGEGRVGRDGVSLGAVADRRQARRRPGGGRARRRRDRHGDRPRRLPLRAATRRSSTRSFASRRRAAAPT